MRDSSENDASAFAPRRGSQVRSRRLAVHRTIVVIDVVGFGDQCRTNAHQVTVRDGMYQVMGEAFDRVGISWDDCDCEDRGDGLLILVPAEVPKGLLVESLPFALVTALRGHNSTHLGPEQIRLRMALHAGEVRYDQHGVTGMAVNLAFRLLEAAPLKQALASSRGVLAVISSSWFYAEVTRQTPVAGEYHCVDVAVKETTTLAWIYLPDRALTAKRLAARPALGRFFHPCRDESSGRPESDLSDGDRGRRSDGNRRRTDLR